MNLLDHDVFPVMPEETRAWFHYLQWIQDYLYAFLLVSRIFRCQNPSSRDGFTILSVFIKGVDLGDLLYVHQKHIINMKLLSALGSLC